MRDERFDDRFEADLRAALRHELATARVGVAAPQVRGRIAARDRNRRTTRLVLLAAALLAGLLAVPVVGALLRERAVVPPGAAEPATVAAIDAASGDVVLSRAWPDGRVEETTRYAGGLDRLREATGDDAATALPPDAVAMLANDGWLAVALSDGDVLWFAPPDGVTSLSGVFAGGEPGWVGWLDDGRLAIVGPNVSLFDPRTGTDVMTALPARVLPDWARGSPQRLAMTGDGRIVAIQGDPATFQTTLGTVDLTAEPPSFTAGIPSSVRAATGLETRYAADGSWPGSGCQDDRLAARCAGIATWESQETWGPTSTWYVAASDEALNPDTIRTADGKGLLIVARSMAADRGRVLVAAKPGVWRQALAFEAPAFDARSQEAPVAGQAYLVGVAPGGRTVAQLLPAGLLVGDLETGATATMSPGSLFVGWPSAPVVPTSGLTAVPACRDATVGEAAAVALVAAGVSSPASAGQKPVVGDRQDADPYRRDDLAAAPAVVAEVDGLLSLALPDGTCAEAAVGDAVPTDGADDGRAVELGQWLAGNGTVSGLATVVAPPPGDWVVRVRLWLAGADREAILLYHVVTAGDAKPVVAPTPTPTPEPTPTSTPIATPAGFAPDTVAVVVATEGLVMRSAPEVSDASVIYAPALPAGAQLYVWDGPVRASGYEWYRVLPLSATYPGLGWVAAASREGERWIEPGRATCPQAPRDVATLAAMPDGLRLACFSGDSIAVRARITPCNCMIDPALAWDPAWFGGVGHREDDLGFGRLLLDGPDASTPSSPDDALWLHLDPSGTYPDPLPVGEVVEVTGIFDHPTARACTATTAEEPPWREPDAPLWCRTSFVVTQIR